MDIKDALDSELAKLLDDPSLPEEMVDSILEELNNRCLREEETAGSSSKNHP
jgi:hypothetical protein